MSHSPEPWKAYPHPYSDPQDPCWELSDSHDQGVCGRKISAANDADGIFRGLTLADAERIVACINACRGLPTEELVRRKFVRVYKEGLWYGDYRLGVAE